MNLLVRPEIFGVHSTLSYKKKLYKNNEAEICQKV